MPVRKKPITPQTVDEFIHSAVTDKSRPSAEAIVPVKLRIPEPLLDQVDAAVSKRRPIPSRHQWLLEAIYEKLERDHIPEQQRTTHLKRY